MILYKYIHRSLYNSPLILTFPDDQGKVFARVDRPSGVVNFRETKSSTEVLNSWSADVNKILGLVERGCHLVNIEAQRKKAAMAMATD